MSDTPKHPHSSEPRDQNQPHRWVATGLTIDWGDGFPEKVCSACGAINWGGAEDGVCPGSRDAKGREEMK